MEKENIREPLASDWDKVASFYMRGETLDFIIKAMPEVRLNKKSIMNKMSRSGITTKKKALDEKIKDQLSSAIEEEKIRTNNLCIGLFNSGATVIDNLLKQYKVESGMTGISKAQSKATAYNIDLLMSGVSKIQKGLRVAYGMDETGKLFEKEPDILVIDGMDDSKI